MFCFWGCAVSLVWLVWVSVSWDIVLGEFEYFVLHDMEKDIEFFDGGACNLAELRERMPAMQYAVVGPPSKNLSSVRMT